MEATIEISNLRKRVGATVALDGMTFTVAPGEVNGFAGPNGAGKSITMRAILGLDAPDADSTLIGGRRYQSLRHSLSHVGSLLDASALQPSRSGRSHLLWLAHSQGLNARPAVHLAAADRPGNPGPALGAPPAGVGADDRRAGHPGRQEPQHAQVPFPLRLLTVPS
jgi:ABC-type multidrug transport system ATPase subunit